MVTTSTHFITFIPPTPKPSLWQGVQPQYVFYGGVGSKNERMRVLVVSAKPGRRRRRRRRKGDLESEILEFMEGSRNPDMFPSKRELVDAGRGDLVEAIVERGDWFLFGWDYSDEGSHGVNGVLNVGVEVKGCLLNSGGVDEEEDDSRMLQQRLDGDGGEVEGAADEFSSLGSIIESEEELKGGIEGILSRLEKERRFMFGGGSTDIENGGRILRTDKDDTVARKEISDLGDKKSSHSTSQNTTTGSNSLPLKFDGPIKPDTWKTWSSKRISSSEFEAAEIGEISDSIEGTEMTPSQMKSRIQNLELELATVLCLLRDQNTAEFNENDMYNLSDARDFQQADLVKIADTKEFRKTDLGKLSDIREFKHTNLHRLSDAGEFQQTEIMNARDQLRSLRAKLAVASGKMAMTIIETQKMVKLKQKKINHATKALSLLRRASIVWPNSAYEVLLTGSFDGWTTQRRMERSDSGIFSISLMLYTGRYQIKFIVDGVWMIDPLRPTVKVDGYENNLLEVL